MKNTKKIVVLVLFALLLAMSLLTSCGNTEKEDAPLKIGIIQYVSHPSLDNCYQGVMESLEKSGLNYEVTRQIGSNQSPDTDSANYARNFVASNYDMIIAIATPSALAAYTATADTDIPVIFCAVSDPVAVKLVQSLEKPGDNCTGTSDVLDLEAQVDLIQAMQPDVKSIGVLYTSSETNSLSNLENFKKICDARGLELVSKAVQSGSDVPSAAQDLAARVDCINNFTDNNVVLNLTSVLSAAENNHIPVYGSEVEQVKNGCLAAVSIEYVALGRVTGDMAIQVLNGADASTMAVRTISDATPVINETVMSELGITMPEAYTATAEIVTGE